MTPLEQYAMQIMVGAVCGVAATILLVRDKISKHSEWIAGADKTFKRHDEEIYHQNSRCAEHVRFFGGVEKTLEHLKERVDYLCEHADREQERKASATRSKT